ncbi:MAG: hypothetical protein JWL72_1445 [Ilumatobacteraceae bacterium]|nr:hypothetical protein [Ilumatobacteraceae bacterium]
MQLQSVLLALTSFSIGAFLSMLLPDIAVHLAGFLQKLYGFMADNLLDERDATFSKDFLESEVQRIIAKNGNGVGMSLRFLFVDGPRLRRRAKKALKGSR